MGNSFLQDRGASFAQRRAEEHLRKARVVRTFALVIYRLLVLCFLPLSQCRVTFAAAVPVPWVHGPACPKLQCA